MSVLDLYIHWLDSLPHYPVWSSVWTLQDDAPRILLRTLGAEFVWCLASLFLGFGHILDYICLPQRLWRYCIQVNETLQYINI